VTDFPLADVVYARLFWGKPRTIGELAEDLAVPRRMVEASIEELRRRGAPICSGSRGVWLTQDADELLDQYRRLRRRAIHQLANIRRMRKTVNFMRGYHQEELWTA
jgi:Mn-dependent DtxR family transcriptional regulator